MLTKTDIKFNEKCTVLSSVANQQPNQKLLFDRFEQFQALVLLPRLVSTETVKEPKRVIIQDERNRNNVSVLLPIII